MNNSKFNGLYQSLLSEEIKERAEKIIIWISITSFVLHLVLIGLVNLDLLHLPIESELLTNPISAIYTPFSFILLFEVYLLVYHIPQSTSDYIAKQYEIITLIVIRRIFKDIAHLDLSINWFEDKYDLLFTYDIITALLLFALIYVFHRLNDKKVTKKIKNLPEQVQHFIARKKAMATLLVPIIVIMACYSLSVWLIELFTILTTDNPESIEFMNVNNIFFDEFFTLLILTDVLLLLFSFFHTTKFHLFIRNSGFIISTILIRISFSIDGIVNNLLIVVAVSFGVLILLVNKQYVKLSDKKLKV
ncbi:MAG: hypothetical protein RLO81_14320 [Fulvivirga sp.]|uniref:hypothetical protein n=1 Tax=Fulvivirga sp. TaxID=1931237 RepID=UPI0032ECCCC4